MRSLFNIVLLKEQLKRYWAIGALTLLAYVLICIMPIWSTNDIANANRMLLQILSQENPLIIIINILAPLAAVIAIFSYMYQQNATGVIHSLPLSKKQLFAGNVLAGYLLIAVPLLIFSLLLLIVPIKFGYDYNDFSNSYSYSRTIALNIFPNSLQLNDTINTFSVVCGFFGRTLLSFTFYYALFIMAAMIVGNQVIYFLMSLILPFLTAGFYLLYGAIASYYVFGFSFNSDLFEPIMLFTNPIILPTAFTYITTDGSPAAPVASLLPYYVVYIVITCVLLAISAWLYHVRKLERAGDTVVFTPLKNFFIFLLSIIGMISFGVLMLVLLRSITLMYAGFVVGFILAFFIAQMIAEKSFNVFYKHKSLLKHGGVALALFAVIMFICKADITGYERFKPDSSDVEGVYLDYAYALNNYRPDSEAFKMMFVGDPQIINDTLSVHGQIINNRKAQRKIFLDNMASNYRTDKNTSVSQSIIYKLKNGKLVTRQYQLSDVFYVEIGLPDLLASDPVILSSVFWLNSPKDIVNLNLNSYYMSNNFDRNYTNPSVEITERAEIMSLIEAIKADCIALGKMKESIRTEQEQHDLYTGDRLAFSVQATTNKSKGLNSYYYINLDYYTNTLAWLDEHGYESMATEREFTDD